jgi:histidine phosphotransferase ChpT
VDALLLAETLAARLCHDLAGTANALVGAIDELREAPDDPAEALALAQDAGDAMVRRLRLVRAAWGNGAAPMALPEWQALAEGVTRRGLHLDLAGLDRAAGFSLHGARLMLNLVLLAAESLPAGGTVHLAGHPDQDVVLRIAGPRAAWPAGLAVMLADPAGATAVLADGGPRLLQAALTALVAHGSGQRVSMLMGPPDTAPPLLACLSPVN